MYCFRSVDQPRKGSSERRNSIDSSHYVHQARNDTKRFYTSPLSYIYLHSVFQFLLADCVMILLVHNASPQPQTDQLSFLSFSAGVHFLYGKNRLCSTVICIGTQTEEQKHSCDAEHRSVFRIAGNQNKAMLHSTALTKLVTCRYTLDLTLQIPSITDKIFFFLLFLQTWSVLARDEAASQHGQINTSKRQYTALILLYLA